MKVHIEIDCTPEEARSFMGLPDVEKANDVYVEMMTNAMKGVSNTEKLQEYAAHLAPMGQVGLKLFQNFMANGAAMAEGASRGSDSDKKK